MSESIQRSSSFALLTAVALNIPFKGNVRGSFRRTVVVGEPPQESACGSDAVASFAHGCNVQSAEEEDHQDAVAAEKENAPPHQTYDTSNPEHPSQSHRLTPSSADALVVLKRRRTHSSTTCERDLVTALGKCGFPSPSAAVFSQPSRVIIARIFSSVWRRILRTHPHYIVGPNVDPTAYHSECPPECFQDPPVDFEHFVGRLICYSSSCEPMAPWMALYWIDQVAQRATEAALRYARDAVHFTHNTCGITSGLAYKHHWLVGSAVNGVPVSPFTWDARFSLRPLLALLPMAYNIHGDFNFSIQHLIQSGVDPRLTSQSVSVRRNFIPFDAVSIGAIQWNFAAALDFSMLVFGDDLVAMLGRYLSFDELSFVVSAALAP